MTLSVSVDFTVLLSAGKQFSWPRPHHCPRCKSIRLWGHGYVERYFDPLSTPAWVKRYRCPDCHAVHTLRPDSHWRRFQAPIARITESIRSRLAGRPLGSPPDRCRQQYWWRGYRKQSHFDGLPPATLEELLSRRIILATHSLIERAPTSFPEPPHRRLSSTAPPEGTTLSGGG